MHNSRLIFLLVSIVVCSLLAPATTVTVDPDTNCPTGVAHKCKICVEDGAQYGCFCELEDGSEIITPNLNTPCPIKAQDPCNPNPCANGATCAPKTLTDFICTCTAGKGGKFCNETLPKCGDAGYTCPNAECINTVDSNFPVYCQCYDGTRRDPSKNQTCPPSPCYEAGTSNPICQNNGTCSIVNNAAVCQCRGGWTGANCTKALKTPLCESKPTACGPGRCYQTAVPERYFCDCGAYPNTVAKELIDLTACDQSSCYMNQPCQNGGTCTNKDKGAFACLCPPQYVGSRCEKQSACFSNPCRNQGTCQAFNETTYVCACPPYFTGQNCEISVPNPCANKNCSSYGVCEDFNGIATCRCNDGLHHDGKPCQDPCIGKNCNVGVCVPKKNATYEAYCSCPIYRKGDNCELPNDVCRERPPCGGGYCRPNYANTRQYECVCEKGVVSKDPCPFSRNCLIGNCGTKGVCVETGGLIIRPGTLPINYVCSCQDGYISSSDCDGLLNTQVPAAIAKCGPNGKPYPSRNPLTPIGCWCNNGTHVEEITNALATPICV